MKLRQPDPKWPKEFQQQYYEAFLPDYQSKQYIVSNEIFSKYEVLDCLENEVNSALYIAKLVKSYLNDSKTNSILVVGSGSGKLGTQIRNLFPKINLYEVDKNSTVVKRLQDKYKYDFTRKPICSEAHKLPFKDGTIDAILCYSVFRYIENTQEVLNEFMRVIKKDGVIVVSEAKDKHTIERVKYKLKENDIPYKRKTIPTIRLPHLTFFYYLISKYGKDKKVTKMIDQRLVDKEINIIQTAFKLAGFSLGSIYSIIWSK